MPSRLLSTVMVIFPAYQELRVRALPTHLHVVLCKSQIWMCLHTGPSPDSLVAQAVHVIHNDDPALLDCACGDRWQD